MFIWLCGKITVRKPALPPAPLRLWIDPAGRGAAVMAVRNVERGHFRELAFKKRDVRRIRHRPRTVAHAVRRGEIDLRRRRR